nr:methyltransferase domain-containing protein [Lysobacter sp. CAU 1642]
MLQALTVLHPGGRGWQGDLSCEAGHLPFGSETFNLVYLLHALEQEADPAALVRECVRCLQPEGLLIALVFNPLSPFRLRWPAGRLRSLSGATLERMLRDAGLTVERRFGAGRLLPRGGASRPPRGGRLHALSAPFLSSQALIARKRRAAPTMVGPAAARLRARATPS